MNKLSFSPIISIPLGIVLYIIGNLFHYYIMIDIGGILVALGIIDLVFIKKIGKNIVKIPTSVEIILAIFAVIAILYAWWRISN